MTNYNNTHAENSTQQNSKKSMMNEDFVYDGDIDSSYESGNQKTGGSSINRDLDRSPVTKNQRE